MTSPFLRVTCSGIGLPHSDEGGFGRACSSAAWLLSPLLSGCLQQEDPGNLSVFCDLLNDGIGLSEGDTAPSEYERLAKVAPPELRPTVERLRVAALQFDELDPLDLDGRFGARFNSDAVGAQSELRAYAVATCGVSADGQPTTPSSALRGEIDRYLSVAAAGRPWLDKVELFPATAGDAGSGGVESVRVVFVAEPDDAESAAEVCSVVSGWLYGQKLATGNVTVDHDGVILAQRLGVNGECTAS